MYNLPESMGHSKGHAKGNIYSYKCAYIKKIDFSNNLMMPLEKQEQTKPQTSRWREIIKIKNKIKTKKLCKESMKQKVDSLKRLTRSTHPQTT
jgi:hypothetical protein